MPRKKHAAHENHERWLVSYADFITLLFAFFVVMFASSQTDKARVKQFSEAIKEALGEGGSVGAGAMVAKVLGGTVDDVGQGNAMMKGPGGAQRSPTEAPDPTVAELLPSLASLSRDLQEEIRAGMLEVSLEPRGLVVSLKQAAFFPSGGDDLNPDCMATMDKLAKALASIKNSVRLEGHTDSVPIHTARFPSNWELSAARAITLLNLFSGKYGIPRERMAVVGYADTMPVASNDTPEGRARNRRVDIVIASMLRVKPPEGAQKQKKSSHQAKAPAAHH